MNIVILDTGGPKYTAHYTVWVDGRRMGRHYNYELATAMAADIKAIDKESKRGISERRLKKILQEWGTELNQINQP